MITLLCGENVFAVDAEQKRIAREFLAEHDAFGLERLDGEEFDTRTFRDALLQLPFLVAKKLVIIRSPFAAKATMDFLSDILPQVPDEVDVLLVEPKPDKRTKLYKDLVAKKQVKEHAVIKSTQLERWVSEYAGQCGGTVDSATARYLVDRVGEDQMLLAREIEKLALHAPITKDLIDDLTDQSLKGSVFDLLDAAFARHTQKALDLYATLTAKNVDSGEVLAMIGWQLHAMALVKVAGASGSGLHPYVAGKIERSVSKLSLQEIKRLVTRALEIDVLIKTKPVAPETAVKTLIIEIAS